MSKFYKFLSTPGVFFRDYFIKRYPFPKMDNKNHGRNLASKESKNLDDKRNSIKDPPVFGAGKEAKFNSIDNNIDSFKRSVSRYLKIDKVFSTIEHVKMSYKSKNIVVIFDNCDFNDRFSIMKIKSINSNDPAWPVLIDNYGFSDTVFIYACTDDVIGCNIIRKIIINNGIFIPVSDFSVKRYCDVNNIARDVLIDEFARQKRGNYSKFSLGDFSNIIQSIEVTKHMEGSYVEIGTFNGSSASVALEYMRRINLKRNCYFLDVFDGFNYVEAKESSDRYWEGTHTTHGEAVVSKRLMHYSSQHLSVNVIKSNIITDSIDYAGQICVANVDVDIYEAVRVALEKVAPRIIVGGIILVEDPQHTPALIGARVAYEDFMATPIAQKFLPIFLEGAQFCLIRVKQ